MCSAALCWPCEQSAGLIPDLENLEGSFGSDSKSEPKELKSVYNAGDLGSTPGSGRAPGEGNGNPLQSYCLENPMDRRAW